MSYEDIAKIIDDNGIDPKHIIEGIKRGIEAERIDLQINEALGNPSVKNFENIQTLERLLNFLVSFYFH